MTPSDKTVRKAGSSSRRKTAKTDGEDGVVTICVTEAQLDNFWATLSLEEKAHIFERQLEDA